MKRRHTPTYVHSSYFSNVNTKKLKERVRTAKKLLKNLEFDAIAFMGMSGAILAAPLAMTMGKPLIMVRKPRAKTHSGLKVEGDAGAKRYIIVDNFMESGDTVRFIYEKIKVFAPKAVLLGVHEMHKQYKYTERNARFPNGLTPITEVENA